MDGMQNLWVPYYVAECTATKTNAGKPYLSLVLCSEGMEQEQLRCYWWEAAGSLVGRVLFLVDGLPEANAKGFIGFDSSRVAEVSDLYQSSEELQQKYPCWRRFLYFVPTAEDYRAVLSDLLAQWMPEDLNPTDLEALSPRQRAVVGLFKHVDNVVGKYTHCVGGKRAHHSEPEGLAIHTYEILNMIRSMAPSFPSPVDLFVLTFAAFYHDFGKLTEYTEDAEYTERLCLYPHPVQGSDYVRRRYEKVLSSGLLDRICHAILAHNGRPEWLVATRPATIEAVLLSELDLLSARMWMFRHGVNMDYNQFAETRLVTSPSPEV